VSINSRRALSISDTRRALHALYREDPESSAKKTLLHIFEDELTPVDSRGRWRPSKLLAIIVGIVLTTVCVFAYFSVKQ
jgi:hypothetical protein